MGGGVGLRRVAWSAGLAALSLLWPEPVPGAGQEASGQRPSPLFLAADASAFNRSIRRAPEPRGIRISYEWRDGRERDLRIDVVMAPAALAESEASFGFSPRELELFLIDTEVRVRVDMGLTAMAVARKAAAQSSGPSWWSIDKDPTNDFQFVLRTDAKGRDGHAAEIERIIRSAQRAWKSSRRKIAPRLEKETKAFLAARGMVMTPRGIAVDYKALVRENRDRLAPLAADFKRICGPNKKALLDAVLSFVQNIPSRPRPSVEGEKYTAGLAVPLRVLADDSGDCDSKAVLFAALWTGLCRHRTILVSVPDHMLVGVAVPFVEGASLELDGARYVLLEVNCGRSVPPGEISGHSFAALKGGQLMYRIVS
jgi:hypothetical protein